MSRTLLLAVAALFALSGCTDAPEQTAPAVVTSPTDYDYLSAPTPAGSHVHDYWHGESVLPILEASDSRTPVEGFGRSIREYVWAPATDVVIPQGTAEVHVTIDWTSDTSFTHTPPELHYRTASLRNWTVAGPIVSGQTMVIPSDNLHNDVPHQRLSAWAFSLWYDGDGPGLGWAVKSNQVHVKVEAVRGAELPVYPAHPDQWDNRSSIPIFDWESPMNRLMVAQTAQTGNQGACLNSCTTTADPLDGAIVPFDAAYVEARLTVLNNRTGAVGDLDLAYHGSDTRAWTVLQPDRTEGNVHYYYIPIDGQADGPYAHETQWQFHVYNDEASPAFNGFYRIEATVYRYAMPF